MAAKKPVKRPTAKTPVPPKGKKAPMTGPQKVAARKAAIAKKSKVAQAVSSPAKYAASSKIKTQAYGKTKQKKESGLEKAARLAFEFSPLGMGLQGAVAALNTVTGKNFNKSPYDKSGKWIGAPKGNRLGSATDFALMATPYSKINKVRKARKAANAARLGKEIVKSGKTTKQKQGAVVYNKKKAIYG